jgi:hypothetical protein
LGGTCRNYLKESQRCKVCANFKKRKETFAARDVPDEGLLNARKEGTKSRDVVGIDDRGGNSERQRRASSRCPGHLLSVLLGAACI